MLDVLFRCPYNNKSRRGNDDEIKNHSEVAQLVVAPDC